MAQGGGAVTVIMNAEQVTAKGMTRNITPAFEPRRKVAMRLKSLALAGFLCSVPALWGAGAMAQQGSPFAPVMKVNESVITQFELDQRMRFLTLLRIPGDPVENAMKALINDRLAAFEARRAGLKLTAEQVGSGMSEFATRANLSAEEFIAALKEGGVEAETFRDFVANGLLWRELVRAKYGPLVNVTETEVDRAIANGTKRTAFQLLLSEIVIPIEGEPDEELALANKLRKEITSEGAFVSAAHRYSASPTAGRGGRLDWMPAANLPGQLTQLVIGLGPGQVSQPVITPEAVALFQLRDIAEDQTSEPPIVAVEYAQFLLPNTDTVMAEVEALSNKVDTCKDLWEYAKDLPEDRLTVETKPLKDVPQDIALELAPLDPGEHSAALTRGGNRVFLMLCGREPVSAEGGSVDRAAVRNQLQSDELAAQAEVWLEELRSEAIIVQP